MSLRSPLPRVPRMPCSGARNAARRPSMSCVIAYNHSVFAGTPRMGNSMITPAAIPQKPHSVRAPFRLLAGFICLAGSVAVLGTAYLAWRRGTQLVPLDFVVWLPGMAWIMRLAFHAAVHGSVAPKTEHWPFASSRVANCYFLITLLYSASPSH